MWEKIPQNIIKKRGYYCIAIITFTFFMLYHARKVEINYEVVNVVPKNDQALQYFNTFKAEFGEDDDTMVIGLQDIRLYQLENFTQYKYFTDQLFNIPGVKNVWSLANLKILTKDLTTQKLIYKYLFDVFPNDQTTLDSLVNKLSTLKLYENLFLNTTSKATFILLKLDSSYLNSEKRNLLIQDINQTGLAFSKATDIKLYYGGLPCIRTMLSAKVKDELKLFLLLSLVTSAIILLLLFRSFLTMLFTMLVIIILLIIAMGTTALLNYKITLLTALLPPIIVIIGIPNCVYLLNKYHYEYKLANRNKQKALCNMLYNLTLPTFLTNFTTAIGFLVLAFNKITILKEFGILAGINVLATFFISIITIPIFFSFLPPPNTKHLKNRLFARLLDIINHWVKNFSTNIFIVTAITVIVAAIGLGKLKAISYIIDDVSPKNPLIKDLHFFEKNFGGVIPLEIIIDTRKPQGVYKRDHLKRVNQLEIFLEKQSICGKPLSILTFLKATRQAYYNDNPVYYDLFTAADATFLLEALKILSKSSDAPILKLTDKKGQKMRIALKIKDVGSKNLEEFLENTMRPTIEAIFENTKTLINYTGTSLLFLKSNQFLITNLIISLLLAILLIATALACLFKNIRIIGIAIVINLIPLLITAGVMGYLGMRLKPSTALIFSIAFGIAVDDSIHFLTKYKLRLRKQPYKVSEVITQTLKEVGLSMLYTSIALISGFSVFLASEFQGTFALGLLIGITLFFAMLTNLILLPTVLLKLGPKT